MPAKDAHSGAGYIEITDADEGELCFLVSSDREKDVHLTVRGRGSANAEIVIEGNAYPLSFDELNLWEEVATAVHLDAGQNSVMIRKHGSADATLHIDYIEFE